MTGRLLVLAAIVAALVVASTDADGHTSYAGHGCAYWDVVIPTSGTVTKYRECYTNGWGNGPHYHEYQTQYRKYKLGLYYWVGIHSHTRQVKSTHSVL